MSVVVIGLEHDLDHLELIERVAVADEDLAKTLGTLRDRPNLAEVVVLSTCLRTEVYAVVERFHEGVADLQDFLAAEGDISAEVLSERATVLFDDAVAAHLFEVASGLRSAVLGETEVLGQVRRAYERAVGEHTAGPVLSALFRHAVQAGRRVRSTTAIAQGTTSLSHIAVDVATRQLGGSLRARRVVVVGAGEMGAGVVDALSAPRHWDTPGPTPEVVVVNRTAARAATLAARVGGRAVELSGLADELEGADAVIVSTRSDEPLLTPGHVAPVLAARHGRAPLVIVDMGVPRNVAPALGATTGVTLLDMNDLRAHADIALQGRQAEREAAEEIVSQEVERYRADQRARGATPIVSALRGRVEELRVAELDRHRTRLDRLDAEQRAEVESITRDVVAKLMHDPVVRLKETAGSPRGERLAEALRALFDL